MLGKHLLLLDSVYGYFVCKGGGDFGTEEFELLVTVCDIADESSEKCTFDMCLDIFNATKTKEALKVTHIPANMEKQPFLTVHLYMQQGSNPFRPCIHKRECPTYF